MQIISSIFSFNIFQKKYLTITLQVVIMSKSRYVTDINGDIAQLARACGSYPQCRRFKSHYRHQYGPVVKRPKTPPFHGGNTSSNLVRVTKKEVTFGKQKLLLFLSKPQAWHIITRQRVSHQPLRGCISSISLRWYIITA